MADDSNGRTPGGQGPGETNGAIDGLGADAPEGRLFPVAVALRATFDAENHATLSGDVTGLMLDLARVPFEPHEFLPLLQARPAPLPLGWLARARLALRRMGRSGI